MKKLLLVVLLVYPMTALAATYQWTDERGTVNFAEDLGKVPKKYRKKARLLDDAGGGVPQVTETTTELPKAKGDDEPKAKKSFGGKDESAWRREFAGANYNIRQSESEIAALKGRLSDTSKMSRVEYLSIQNSIKNMESRLQQQKQALDSLREAADRAGVPAESRQ